MNGALPRMLIRLFPASFRRRYGDEVLTSWDDEWGALRGLGKVRVLADVVFAALSERLNETGRRAGGIPSPASGGFMNLGSDLKYAGRAIARQPVLSAIAILTLTIGIGATTAIFSVIYGALYQPLPYDDAAELVQITDAGAASPANFRDLRDATSTMDLMAASTPLTMTLTGIGDAARVAGAGVTRDFFDVFGVTPSLGRFFMESDAQEGAEPTVVISHEMWVNQFGSDPGIIGRTIQLDYSAQTVIGVAPPGFDFPGDARVWAVFQWSPARMPEMRNWRFLYLWGRLAPSVGVETARAEMRTLFNGLVDEYPEANGRWRDRIDVRDLRTAMVGADRSGMLMLGGAVILVLLISSANVGNLMLARAETRQREFAIRSALGAGRGRLLRLFMAEGLLVSGIGGVLGITLAVWGVRLLLLAFGGYIPRSDEIGMHMPVLYAATAVTILSGLAVGVMGLKGVNRSNLGERLRARERSDVGRGNKLRTSLVVGEIALALMLVTGAGLLVKSFWQLSNADLGFTTEGVATLTMSVPYSDYGSDGLRQFFDDLLAEIEADPDVVEAGAITKQPFDRTPSNVTMVEAEGMPGAEAQWVEVRSVTPGFFDVLGIAVAQGRDFERADGNVETPYAVINQTLAHTLFGEESAIGHRLTNLRDDPVEVIGVVEDIREWGPHRDVPPTAYFSFHQSASTRMSVLVRVRGNMDGVISQIRDIVSARDSNIPVYDVSTMDRRVADSIGNKSFLTWLLGAFAAVALVLGAIGIYGVMSYTVACRRREIGVRLALGAERSNVLGVMLRRGLGLTVLGAIVGAAGAVALRGAVRASLVDVSTLDPTIYLASFATLVLVAVGATLLPSLRATRVDPNEVLREE